jgi:hypothetical protein
MKNPTQEKETLIKLMEKAQLAVRNNRVIVDNTSKQLGLLILQTANKKKVKLTQLAERAGLPAPRIINWLYGNAIIPTNEARKLWKEVNS